MFAARLRRAPPPYITNGNIYAPVMMLAEKAADLNLGNSPLPAEHTPFYRHKRVVLADPRPTPRMVLHDIDD